ncbi:putative quinol monooxygenase [Pseudonocardia sp. TRM90224]|uniref:putative quinol monooxygenase n=1 Tax=Pseudonocardia sp. TRM90224 TaxID=2812678 RepID=UPI001E5F0B48|nr:antibiotic biosynthesis monooxygenase [Pseudonocardia sp. TRM90224]
MIIRMCEARAKPGALAALRDFLVAATDRFPQLHDGFLGYEILLDVPANSLVWISRWRDEPAVRAYAGAGWRERPVVLPAEEAFLDGPLHVRHFTLGT